MDEQCLKARSARGAWRYTEGTASIMREADRFANGHPRPPKGWIRMSDPVRAIDSLSANEFAVEVDGEAVTGVFRVAGLIAYKLDVRPSLTKAQRDPFTLSKMVQRDPALPFNRWIRETIATKDDIVHARRTVDIVALDDGAEVRRWRVKGAWISEIAYSDFDSGSGELVQQRLTIQYDEIEEIWPET
jgi:phage tail-like protein